MSKYHRLPGFDGVKARLERRNGRGDDCIAFLTQASPYVEDIIVATAKLNVMIDALRDRLNGDDLNTAIRHKPEVIMFHGCYVRTLVWVPAGACQRIGVPS